MGQPGLIHTEKELDDLLTAPDAVLRKFMGSLEGDLMVLGAGGKMGVTLSILALRALREAGRDKKVFAVSRFGDARARESLEQAGVETLSCDLLNATEVSKLPLAGNVIYMAGRKFGTEQDREQTWTINVLAPGFVSERFKKSRIVVFSTGCVYPLVTANEPGCSEDTPTGPVGEYAQTCVGRERIFTHYSRSFSTRMCIYRLNYAVDLRYGVLHDIGTRVFHSRPVDLSVSHFNCIWQGDANRLALLCLDRCSSPPEVLNITGTEKVSVRDTAEKFAAYFNKKPIFSGEGQNSKMYLSDASRMVDYFGMPSVGVEKMIRWQAEWIARGGRSLGKPTHFEVSDGQY